MLQIIAGVIQILLLVFKNKFERDAELRKKKEELYVEAKESVKSGDISRINLTLSKLRHK